jgi:hypothetical protein
MLFGDISFELKPLASVYMKRAKDRRNLKEQNEFE